MLWVFLIFAFQVCNYSQDATPIPNLQGIWWSELRTLVLGSSPDTIIFPSQSCQSVALRPEFEEQHFCARGFQASSFLDLRVWLSCRHIAASGAGLAAFSGKSQRVNILDILGHVFFSTPTFSPKAAVDSMQIDKPGCEPKNCMDGHWNVNFRHFASVCGCLVYVWIYVHTMCVYMQVEARSQGQLSSPVTL